MNKHLFIFLTIAMLISSCEKPITAPSTLSPPTATPKISPTDIPLATVTPACISSKPAQTDTDRLLAYTGNIFSTSDWEKTYTVNETSVSVLWQNAPQSALVYLEAIIFPCGYEGPDLNNYFSDENWKAVFANYESFELIDKCERNDGLRLYEFKTLNQNIEYRVRYWVDNDTDTRVISTMIVFPLEAKLLLDEYSSMLFQDYSTCP
jgi:hypothetical protein